MTTWSIFFSASAYVGGVIAPVLPPAPPSALAAAACWPSYAVLQLASCGRPRLLAPADGQPAEQHNQGLGEWVCLPASAGGQQQHSSTYQHMCCTAPPPGLCSWHGEAATVQLKQQ
jgi:hypothetical protein